MSYSQEIIDRANEWIGVNYPDLDGSDYDAKLADVAAELVAIDEIADSEPLFI
jgi:hypothetical protein